MVNQSDIMSYITEVERFLKYFEKSWKKDVKTTNGEILGSLPLTRANDARIRKMVANTENIFKNYTADMISKFNELDMMGEAYRQGVVEDEVIIKICDIMETMVSELRMEQILKLPNQDQTIRSQAPQDVTEILTRWKRRRSQLPSMKIKKIEEPLLQRQEELESWNLTKNNLQNEANAVSVKIAASNDNLILKKDVLDTASTIAEEFANKWSVLKNETTPRIEEHGAEIRRLQSEKDSLDLNKAQYDLSQATATYNSSISTAQEKVEQLNTQLRQQKAEEAMAIEKAEKAFLFKKKKQEAVAELSVKVGDTQKELDAAVAGLEMYKSQKETVLASLNAKIIDIKSNLDALNSQINNITQNKKTAELQIFQAEREYESKALAKKQAEKAYEDERKVLAVLEKELKKINKSIDEADEKIQGLSKEIEDYYQEIAKIKEAAEMAREKAEKRMQKQTETLASQVVVDAPIEEKVNVEEATVALKRSSSKPVHFLGSEPSTMKDKLEEFFTLIDQAYPDGIIVGLAANHHNLANRAIKIYRDLGYGDTQSFFSAYGYEIKYENTSFKSEEVFTDEGSKDILTKLPIVLEKLNEAYPDKVVGDFRNDNQHWYRVMMKIAKLQGYESKEAFLTANGYTLKNSNVRSDEARDAALQRRLSNLISNLDTAYPDKQVYGLTSRHSSWADTASELAKAFGYDSKEAFLTAHGYTIVSSVVGRPKKEVDPSALNTDYMTDNHDSYANIGAAGRPAHDRTAIIEELKRRYPNGSEYTSADDLFAANPDLAPKKKALANRAKEFFGMPLGKYLKSIGLIGGEASKETQVEEQKERLFSGLSEAYPDKLITNLKREHHSWYTASEALARNEGFEKLEDFFSNYGFVYKEKDYEGILKVFVDELRSRLTTADHIPSSVDKLVSIYADMDFYQPKKAIKFIYGNSKTLDSYLQEIGVLSQPLEEDKEMLNCVEILKERYKDGKKKPLGLGELASSNRDLPITKLSKFIREVLGEKKAEKYYIRNGILQGKPTDLQEFVYCSVLVPSGSTYYYIAPQGLQVSIGDYIITSSYTFGEVKDIQIFLGIDAPQSVGSTSTILRKATEEEKFYGEAIVETSPSQPTTSYGYPQYGSENVRKKVLNMQEIEELLVCLDSMLQ